MLNVQLNYEDTKRIIRGRHSKDAHNGNRKKDTKTKTMIDITLHETIDRVIQTPQNNGGKRMCFGPVSCSCSSSSPYRGNGK